MQNICLELEERRRVEGKRMQSNCLEYEEEKGRVEGTMLQKNGLELLRER